MVATINLPGSKHFKYFVGSKSECMIWLEKKKEEYQERFGGVWYAAYSPERISTNRVARTWRYKDGSRVIKSLRG